jgi:hypothetical protein
VPNVAKRQENQVQEVPDWSEKVDEGIKESDEGQADVVEDGNGPVEVDSYGDHVDFGINSTDSSIPHGHISIA